LRVDVVTLFPELFATFRTTSLVGRAVTEGILELHCENLRDYGTGKHRSVDDTPYGGGSGMVLRVDVMAACLDALDAKDERPAHRILLTPQGAPLHQRTAERLSALPRLVLISGRYEGFDERVRGLVHEEISLGDFVMTGGEVCAMAIVEATVRLLPGVLGNEASSREESHAEDGLLEYPQYTRPAEFRGEKVPDMLSSGNHAKIAAWRKEQALARTRVRRPDLVARAKPDDGLKRSS